MDELAKRFADLAERYGPHIADAAMTAARIEAYSNLVAAGLWLVLGMAMVGGSIFLFRKVSKGEWDEFLMLPAGLLAIFGSLAIGGSIWTIIDPWTWTQINHPEIWIAKKAFKI